jgi:hypothetical protein
MKVDTNYKGGIGGENSGATHWFRYMFYLVIMFNILVEDEFENHY